MGTTKWRDIKAAAFGPKRAARIKKEALVDLAQVDAIAYTRAVLAQNLRQARDVAGLTQAQLAKRMRRSVSAIGKAERGVAHAGERYVRSLLRACRLPMDWKPSAPRAT